MDCQQCNNTACIMQGADDPSGVQRCLKCEYIKTPQLNEACLRCFDDRDCGFLERMDDVCVN